MSEDKEKRFEDLAAEQMLQERENKTAKAKAEIRLLNARADAEEQLHTFRDRYTPRFFYLSLGWLGLVATVLLLQGFKFHGFELERAVLIAAITTTTANILGVLLIVANYFYPRIRTAQLSHNAIDHQD
jgi:hypothetical protein